MNLILRLDYTYAYLPIKIFINSFARIPDLPNHELSGIFHRIKGNQKVHTLVFKQKRSLFQISHLVSIPNDSERERVNQTQTFRLCLLSKHRNVIVIVAHGGRSK